MITGSEPASTRRQALVELLSVREYDFDELRQTFGVPVNVLEEDLRHIDRSLRRGPRRLRVEPPRCLACGLVLRRERRHFHPPSRCPKCRQRRISGPWFRIA